MTSTDRTNKGLALRMLVDVALALHLAAAAAYWWLTPKGFPLSSSRFWLNSILPIVLVSVALAGLVAVHKRRWPIAAVVVLFFTAIWFAGAISGRIVFPISLRGIWWIALAIAVTGLVCFAQLIRGDRRRHGLWFLYAVAGGILGTYAIWAQIPLPASTKPINSEPPAVTVQKRLPLSQSILRPGAGCYFDPAAAELTVSAHGVQVGCLPLLDFERISPDGFWSIFAPARTVYRAPSAHESHMRVQTIRYSDDSVVVVSAPSTDGSLRLTAFTPVKQDTFSHLNTYCYFDISGHRQLSLSFSPIPDAKIEVLPADYPVGRPARFAYLDSAHAFCVVEASSGEKGPFRQLAIGDLKRGEPLTITILDNGRPVASISLEDWSQQVSTVLSPTAGWKLPVNAVEFRRLGEDPTAPVAIWVTLAATPVGRGWEAVGHRAGVYRNRLVFRTHEPMAIETR